MKFNFGHWLLLPGTQAVYPVSVTDVQIEPEALVVTGYSHEVRTRNDLIDGTIITARFSSPMPEVLRVQLTHFKGWRKHFPSAGAREAQAVIEQHTGKRVIETPRLVAVDVPGPAWEVVTCDGETYYVNFLTVKVNVDGTEEVRVWAWNAKNDFRVSLDGSPNFIYIQIGESSIPY